MIETIDYESKSKEELLAIIKENEKNFLITKKKIKTLEQQLNDTRSSQLELQLRVEAEEENITNKLFKRLEDIAKEKNDMLVQVEREEEYLTNTLQKKLDLLQQEKVNLENQLEAEEEYIVNKLQKQLQELVLQKSQLEQRLEEETPASVELKKLKHEFEEYKKKKEKEISSLESENFVLTQQIQKYKNELGHLSSEKLVLERDTEITEEREFNIAKISGGPQNDADESRKTHFRTKSSSFCRPARRTSRSIRPSVLSKYLMRGWLGINDGKSKDPVSQYFVLTEEGYLLGYESEISPELMPEGAAITEINLDLVQALDIKENKFTLHLKSGEVYDITSEEPQEKWVVLISELIPC